MEGGCGEGAEGGRGGGCGEDEPEIEQWERKMQRIDRGRGGSDVERKKRGMKRRKTYCTRNGKNQGERGMHACTNAHMYTRTHIHTCVCASGREGGGESGSEGGRKRERER